MITRMVCTCALMLVCALSGTAQEPMVQHTTLTQVSDTERVLVMMAPGANKDKPVKVMQIKFVKRKS